MPSLTKADTRRVLNVPGPVLIMFPETVQGTGAPAPVSPKACTCGVAKVATAESKRKSPWKPIKLALLVVLGSISVVLTGLMRTVLAGTPTSIVSIGRDTVIRGKVPPPSGASAGSGGENALC